LWFSDSVLWSVSLRIFLVWGVNGIWLDVIFLFELMMWMIWVWMCLIVMLSDLSMWVVSFFFLCSSLSRMCLVLM